MSGLYLEKGQYPEAVFSSTSKITTRSTQPSAATTRGGCIVRRHLLTILIFLLAGALTLVTSRFSAEAMRVLLVS